MITFKCKMCGGDLSFEQGASVAECPYCGTNQTLPKLDDDKRANLYDRANHFRRQNEYDKAMAIYEQILAEDRTDAEAYWSLVLCRYGIEYVEDPASRKRVPTVNRVQYASILADEDYKSALANADAAQRGVYEAEASAIAEIQRGILDISKQEEPFDVFICYKETDANGRRTPDSVLATELYHELTKEGFKVFFSRITLEDKIGSAYEPYIFAALNSARVMVALGTKPEHFNAVWVKNEWSRYLALIRAGADKTLVPAYRDMDPYDLPEEFAHLQAQDMGKLGFMQDLIRGIKKILSKDEPKTVQPTVQQVVTSGGANIDNLMKRAQLFMEDGDWTIANEYLDKVLDENAEYAPAYAGKVQAKLKLKRQDELSESLVEYEHSTDWQKAMRFATPEQKIVYEGYVAGALDVREEKRKNDIYAGAVRQLEKAVSMEDCQAAKDLFGTIPGYRDADAMQRECDEKVEQIKYDKVDAQYKETRQKFPTLDKVRELKRIAESFRQLGANRDAAQRVDQCLELAEQTQEIVYDSACADILQQREQKYFDKAVEVFRALGPGYKDAAQKLVECEEMRKKATKYEELIRQDALLNSYSDSIRNAKECERQANRYREFGDLWDAESRANRFAAKAEKVLKEYYDKAEASMQEGRNGNWHRCNEAASIFDQLGDYRDSEDKHKACEQLADKLKAEEERQQQIQAAKKRRSAILIVVIVVLIAAAAVYYFFVYKPNQTYNSAVVAMNAGNYDEATKVFDSLGDYKDAATQALESQYQKGAALLASGDYDGAMEAFSAISSYKDAATQAQESQYQKAAALNAAGKYDEAYNVYAALTGYKDVDSIIENDDNIAAAAWRAQFSAGNTVQFGRYEQDNNTSNGTEAIEWIVLANDGDTATLISKYGLDTKPYNMELEEITWETCTLRKWLNGDFLNTAFNSEERTKLETVTVRSAENPKYDTNPGNETQDTVFLLSIDEVNKLLSGDDVQRCQATTFAKMQGAYVGDNGYNWWWLRSPGNYSMLAAVVDNVGSVNYDGNSVRNTKLVVRPVVVLRLS